MAVFVTNYGGTLQSTEMIGQSVTAELLGSFLLTFIYLSQADQRTKLSDDAAVFSGCLAATYVAAISIASASLHGFTPLNPAITVGMIYS